MSVRWNDCVHHFLLQRSNKGIYTFDGRKKFQLVIDMIKHYHNTGEPFLQHKIQLLIPVERQVSLKKKIKIMNCIEG